MLFKSLSLAAIGCAAGTLAVPLFGDHSVITYCRDNFPMNCHVERLHDKKCVKLDHPGDIRWVTALDNCWLYSDDDCTGKKKESLDLNPFVFDAPFHGRAVWCS
ncbi:hypothetical protein N7512_002170 [Penicillium capsulatum]|nr:hypothetical protein N7512_002170 [Penicillium capsulatum]